MRYNYFLPWPRWYVQQAHHSFLPLISLSHTIRPPPLPFSHDGYFVDLFVRKSNNVAISMYEKFGYSIYRRVLGYYSGTEDAYGTSSAAVVSVGEGHGKREGEGGLLCLNGDTLLQ